MASPPTAAIAIPGNRVGAEEALSRIGLASNGAGSRQLLVYFHVPFCNSKCIFCDWVAPIPTAQLRSGDDVRRRYTQALRTQIRAIAPALHGIDYVPRHLYWGGGTPTKLEAEDFADVIAELGGCFDLSLVREHTVEASPETLSLGKLTGLREIGVNRLSIGAQSMDDAELRRIGRSHNSQQTVMAMDLAREAGFENVNLDLIVCFPDQTIEMVQNTIDRTMALKPDHVTVYVYRPSPGTVMARQLGTGRREPVELKKMFDFYNYAKLALESEGYIEYSFGYFRKAAAEPFEGEAYYFNLQGDYVGFGSGAISILSHHILKNDSTGLHAFLERPDAFDSCEKFSPDNLDDIFPSLRMTMLTQSGLDFAAFERMFGFEFARVRHDPLIQGYLDYFRWFGTAFDEDDRRLSVTPQTRARGNIVSLLGLHTSMRSVEERLTQAFHHVQPPVHPGSIPIQRIE